MRRDAGDGAIAFESELAQQASDDDPAVSFAHGFEGCCEACGVLVQVDDRVHRYADDVVVHERCPSSRERAQA